MPNFVVSVQNIVSTTVDGWTFNARAEANIANGVVTLQ
jgi:hypothetical protein